MKQTAKNPGCSRVLVRLFAAAAIVLGAVGGSQLASAGIANTRHNLGTTGTVISGQNHVTSGTAEICVFCHTPHGSDNTVKAPLWNKGTTATGSYTTYDSNHSTTINGTILSVGSVSLACLSCHDGTQAMDSMINAPGSGWGKGTGTAVSQAYTWTGSDVDVATGKLATGIVPNLGTDLSNDHPVGIEFCGGTTTAGTYTGGTSGTCVNKDFRDAATKTINGQSVWWVDNASTTFVNNGVTTTINGTALTREKIDMFLYTRSDSGSAKPYVECASCHDPHVESKGDATAPQVAFLRVSQAGSGVCLACHTK